MSSEMALPGIVHKAYVMFVYTVENQGLKFSVGRRKVEEAVRNQALDYNVLDHSHNRNFLKRERHRTRLMIFS